MSTEPEYLSLAHLLEESMNEINQDIVIFARPKERLVDILTCKKMPALYSLAQAYSLEGYLEYKKADLIILLAQRMANPDIIAEKLSLLQEWEWRYFQELSEKDCILLDRYPNFRYMLSLSLSLVVAFSFSKKFAIIIPTEIRQAFHNLKYQGFLAKKQQRELLQLYANGAVNLYGVIRKLDLYLIFCRQNNVNISFEELLADIAFPSYIRKEYRQYRDFLVGIEFEMSDFQGVDELVELAENYTIYVPEKNTFLDYSNYRYVEDTPQTKALYQFLEANFKKSARFLDYLVKDMASAARFETSLEDLYNILDSRLEGIKEEQKSPLDYLLKELIVHARLWRFHGHTWAEVESRQN